MRFLIKLSNNPNELCIGVELDSVDPLISEIVSAARSSMSVSMAEFVFRKYSPFLAIPERGLKLQPNRTASYYGLVENQILYLMASGV